MAATTVEEACERGMTMSERLTRLVPTEIEFPDKPGEGYKKYFQWQGWIFTCAQCGKKVEAPMEASSADWMWKKPNHRGCNNYFCGWNCMRAWEKAHPGGREPATEAKPKRKTPASFRPYTAEDDWLIWHLYYEQGLTQEQIAQRLTPKRSAKSVQKRMEYLRTRKNATPEWMRKRAKGAGA